ncbi:MAG: hypothetical protein E7587_08885 [Ruminococcaceae bacterium]|nr:hypothetical protein [Oscillospiraceae bacterium]
MLKKSRFFVAVALLVQAFSSFIMFIILCAKKKSISAAFLAVATMEAATGAYLLYQEKQELDAEMDFDGYLDDTDFDLDDSVLGYDLRHGKDDDEMYDEGDIDILKDDTVSEDEFKEN